MNSLFTELARLARAIGSDAFAEALELARDLYHTGNLWAQRAIRIFLFYWPALIVTTGIFSQSLVPFAAVGVLVGILFILIARVDPLVIEILRKNSRGIANISATLKGYIGLWLSIAIYLWFVPVRENPVFVGPLMAIGIALWCLADPGWAKQFKRVAKPTLILLLLFITVTLFFGRAGKESAAGTSQTPTTSAPQPIAPPPVNMTTRTVSVTSDAWTPVTFPPYIWFDFVHETPIVIQRMDGKKFNHLPDGTYLDEKDIKVPGVGDEIPGSRLFIRARDEGTTVKVEVTMRPKNL